MSLARRAPRTAAAAIRSLAEGLAPATLLADVQRAWPEVVGDRIAAVAHPAATREGTVIVICSSSVWAQEIELMGPEIVGRVNAALGEPLVVALSCRATPPRSWTQRAQ